MKKVILFSILVCICLSTVANAEGKKPRWYRSSPNTLSLDRTDFRIELSQEIRIGPYILIDPQGRTLECSTLSYCQSEGERQAKERQEFEPRTTTK